MNATYLKQYFVELIGTFFLVFTVLTTGKPLAIGLALAAAIYLGANISGGHYNPAVTLALWLRGKFSLVHLPGYMVSQVIGAFAAGAAFYYFFGKIVYPAPVTALGTLKPILLETIGTFLFCAVILETTSPQRQPSNVNGLIIGLTLATVALMVGSFSGGAFNPAVGTGPILFDFLKGGSSVKFLPIYLIGPLSGGILASIFYLITHKE